MNSTEDLIVNLEQCEKLFFDLRYVKSDIVKCFPPDFPVFEIFRGVYIGKILQRIGQDIRHIVTAEPTIVVTMNQFVKTMNDAMEELGFTDDMKGDMQQLFMWAQYQPIYSEYTERKISEFFQNISSSYLKQEKELCDNYKNVSVLQTETVGDIAEYMYSYAEQVRDNLAGERLFEVLQILVRKGPIEFVDILVKKSLQDCSGNQILTFIAMMVRANEIEELLREQMPKFKQKCLEIQAPEMYTRTQNFFQQEISQIEQALLEIVACVSLFVLRLTVQSKFIPEVFTQSWLQPQGKKSVVRDAFENLQTFLNDINRYVRWERSREKIQNILFALMVDGYFERLLIALQFNYNLKGIKGTDVQELIYQSIWTNHKALKLSYIDFA